MDDMKMEAGWMENIRCWGGDLSRAKHWFDYLVAQYTSSDRKYHSLDHVSSMLDLAEEYKSKIDNWCAFYLAIWFHDVVQNGTALSEMLSAQKCIEAIADLKLSANAKEAIDLILATKEHQGCSSFDAGLFVDMDLAVLGFSRKEYQKYARQCRAEYKIPDRLYQGGRAKVLMDFLQRKHIYQTSAFRKRFECRARQNIHWELEAMAKGVPS